MLGIVATLLAWVPDPVITGPPPPPPPAGAPLGLGPPIVVLTLLSIAWAIVWAIARRFTKAGTLRAMRIGAFGAAIGNALMDLASIMQPDRPAVVEIEQARDDGAGRAVGGDPPDG